MNADVDVDAISRVTYLEDFALASLQISSNSYEVTFSDQAAIKLNARVLVPLYACEICHRYRTDTNTTRLENSLANAQEFQRVDMPGCIIAIGRNMLI